MKIKKIIKVFSNGTLTFSYNVCNNLQFINFYNKDNKNFYLNTKKQNVKQTTSEFFNYRSKYTNK